MARSAAARARLLGHVVGDLGLPVVGLIVVNSVRRQRAWRRENAGRNAPRPGVTPGILERTQPIAGGARFNFAHAQLEVSYLAADVVLVCWSPGPEPVGYSVSQSRPGLPESQWPLPSVLVTEHPGRGWNLVSDELDVHVGAEGATEVSRRDGTVIRSTRPPVRRGGGWEQEIVMRAGERFSGLGEQAAGVDLRGGRFRVWNRDAGGAWGPGSGPLYMGIPLVVGSHRDGDSLTFYENSTYSVFSFGDADAPREREGRAKVVFSGGSLSAKVMTGDLPHLLDRYTTLTGRPSLPPRWALGYHQSRWGYRSASDVREVLDGYEKERVPLSALHLDIDYMDGYRVFTVDRTRFGDLAELAAQGARRGVGIVTIIDPGVKVDPGYDLYAEGSSRHLFCTDVHGNPVEGVVWPGRAVFPDFTNPRTRDWWAGNYRVLTDQGVAGFWDDMNEPASISLLGDPTLPLETRHDLDGRGGIHAEAHNIYGLLMNRSGFEGLLRARPERRPFIVSRSGWAGNQRWAWTWTGDAASTWAAMRQQVATLVGLGMSGVPFAGSDIGGFSGVPDDELYLRWLQMSVFMGFCRTHSVVGAPPREPWRFAEPTRSEVGAWIRFRYRLLPYLYTLAHQSAECGAPLVRPVWWPHVERTSNDEDGSFLLGDALLVAPVSVQGARSRRVEFPPGDWTSLWSEDRQPPNAGVQTERTLDAPLSRMPVLVRAGTILPLDDGFAEGSGPCRLEADPKGAPLWDTPAQDHAPRLLSFHCWPDARGEARGLCIDDAGEGFGEKRHDEMELSVPPEEQGRCGVLSWRRTGGFPAPERVRVVVHGWSAARAIADGVEVAATETGAIETAPFERLEIWR